MLKTLCKYLFGTAAACAVVLVALVVQPLFRIPEKGAVPFVDAATLKAHVRGACSPQSTP